MVTATWCQPVGSVAGRVHDLLAHGGGPDGESYRTVGPDARTQEHVDARAGAEVEDPLPGAAGIGEVGPGRDRDVAQGADERPDRQVHVVVGPVELQAAVRLSGDPRRARR